MKLTGTVKGGRGMNEKFYHLPAEKQNAIINAGYRVFSQNTYKKSPMQEIADEARISKALLFHYFKNKKELYLFLWDNAAKYSIDTLTAAGCYDMDDLFEMLYTGMKAKVEIMRQYPDMGAFVLKAYYEKDPEVAQDIQESYQSYFQWKAAHSLRNLPSEQFISGIDMDEIFRHMFWEADGYLLDCLRNGTLDVGLLEIDFTGMIEFWKKIYGKRGERDGSEAGV